MKNLFLSIALVVSLNFSVIAQPSAHKAGTGTSFASFIDYQKTFSRPDESFRRKEDTLQKQFAQKKLKWPANYIYIRSFKYDSQLEVWVKDKLDDPFQLFKTYKVCALAGTLGPKRLEGDYQVPEGFYYINEFNPKSSYYLSLGINYPNTSDRILSDSIRPGAGIYIHGSCVTVGCIPLTDEQIDEVYILAAHAKSQGQDYIPDAQPIHELNYSEVIEMAYYGAQVIHPKTIKPLQNKNIPLYVKCFLKPSLQGTIIHNRAVKHLPPIIVLKENQVMLEMSSRDFSFVGEHHVGYMYHLFEKLKVKPNLTQNAAISFICVLDDREEKIEKLALEAAGIFDVQAIKGLSLLTIRHYNTDILEAMIKKKSILLRQQTPDTIQVLIEN